MTKTNSQILDKSRWAGKTIILDTNVLVDSFSEPEKAADLFQSIKDNDCAITTIDLVRVEFLSGSRSTEEFSKKIVFLQTVLTHPELPASTQQKEFSEEALLSVFGNKASSFKAVDFALASTLKKYSSNVCLLTNDHKDFNPGLFTICDTLILEKSDKVTLFGLYKFTEEKYYKELERSFKNA